MKLSTRQLLLMELAVATTSAGDIYNRAISYAWVIEQLRTRGLGPHHASTLPDDVAQLVEICQRLGPEAVEALLLAHGRA